MSSDAIKRKQGDTIQWTPEMNHRLRTLRASGASWVSVGLELDVSGVSARKQAARLALPPGAANVQWTPEEDALLIKMRAEGRSWEDVGKVLKRSGGVCYKRTRCQNFAAQCTPETVAIEIEDMDRPAYPPMHPATWNLLMALTPSLGASA